MGFFCCWGGMHPQHPRDVNETSTHETETETETSTHETETETETSTHETETETETETHETETETETSTHETETETETMKIWSRKVSRPRPGSKLSILVSNYNKIHQSYYDCLND